ncbi:pentapeptide repeat-containing protein [Micromonospora sp. STR1_7]|uniref:Pentapeptide repeat-containing protein n=1 Tax=Micromonospora parastrephiae TaxID=2806101 RepID=A0ABS1XYS1_9ACTN|nr:pentapeptide repeat-containing protein [Micromonospora parastrephiae]MBM0234392.1 pentapeptide repeat-containing protein [Micromonospora parastrephiae]
MRWLGDGRSRYGSPMRILPGATRHSFAGQDLRHRTLDGHSFKLCDFRGADLRGASLRGASFAGCDLRGADLRDTDLSYARFSAVRSHDPEYGRTDVSGARWDGATLRGVVADRVTGWPHDI